MAGVRSMRYRDPDGAPRRSVLASLDSDPHLSNVVLLCDFKGKNGSTTLCDYTGKVATTEGNAHLSNVRARFGETSSLLDGNNDSWAFDDHADFDLSAGDYTVEASVYLVANSGGNQIILNKGGRFGVSFASWALFVDSANVVKWQMGSGGGSATAQIVAGPTIATGGWYDLAVEQSGRNILFFANNVLHSTTPITTGITNGSTGLWIGDYRDNTNVADCWNGNMGALRITKSVARRSYAPRRTPFPKR